jgi:hypothetical protein
MGAGRVQSAGMRRFTLGIAVCLWAHHLANAKPSPEAGRDREEVPYQASVSEVSKDGHVIHNRLTFDCQPADGASGWPPKEIDCVVIQQDLQEPSPPPTKEVLDKQVAEMTEGDKLKDLCQRESTPRPKEGKEDIEFRKKIATACGQASRTAVVAALTDIFRSMDETASRTCTMMTIVQRNTFSRVKKGVWVSSPNPYRTCTNVAVTGTLRQDREILSNWNYTEVTVATPSKDSLCHAESGTTQFTWRQAFTSAQLNCRLVQM